MINISLSLNLPIVKFKSIFSWHKAVFENYVVEFEVNQTTSIVGVNLVTRPFGDHRGFDIGFSLFFFDMSVYFYDVNHMD